MNQKKMLQLLCEGHSKVDEARQIILSDKNEDKEKLLILRKWFYQNADLIKNALQNDIQVDHERRQMLEKLVSEYTITIIEIDDKINRDNALVKS